MSGTAEENGARLGVGYNYGDGASGWGENVNRTMQLIDTLLGGGAVKSATMAAPPASPATGDAYYLPVGSTAAWAGHDGNLAVWQLGAWQFFPGNVPGLRVYVEDTGDFSFWNGTAFTQEAAAAAGPTTIEQLSDVEVTSLANGQTLAWNATAAKWENVTPATGGGGGGSSGPITPAWRNVPPQAQQLPLGFIMPGKPAVGQAANLPMGMQITVPANLAGTVVYCGAVATASAVFTLNRIAGGTTLTQIGTITFTAGSNIACTLSTQAGVSLNAGDVLQLVAPTTADATLSDIGITILTAKV